MLINKLLKYFYTKVFISIVTGKKYTDIVVLSVKGSSTVAHNTQTFKGVEFSEEMRLFIDEVIKTSPLTYIAFLSNKGDQGAIPTCSKQNADNFTDVMLPEYLCFDNQWMMYISRESLYQIQEHYKTVGLDFVFSPFALIKQLYVEKINKELAIFILNEENSVALAVFNHGVFNFATYQIIEKESSMVEEDSEEDWDSFLNDYDEDDTEKRYKIIEHALESYYHDSRFTSCFIEKAYFIDSHYDSKVLRGYLEEELFIHSEEKSINIALEVARLAAQEVGYAV